MPRKPTRSKRPRISPREYNRSDRPSAVEKDLVAHLVLGHPGPLRPRQELGLAHALRRSPQVIKALIEEARDKFASNAGKYVDVHMQAAEKALKARDFGVAARAAEWALTNLSADGVRVVEKAQEGPQGAKILVGIQMGGVGDKPVTAITLPDPPVDPPA